MGAFLTDEVNNLYVLSCQHVLSKKNEKPAEEQFQPAEEQTAKKNYMDGVERLKNCISKRREELKKPDESGKIDEKEIKAFESAVRIPGEEEILIEQPAAEDFISEMYKLEKNIREKKSEIKDLEKRLVSSQPWKFKAIESNIETQKRYLAAFEHELDNLTEFQFPRWIATYSCGLQKNYEKPDEKKSFFVDAAIAKINANERDGILSRIQESGPVYDYDIRFSNDKQKKIYEKGKIIPVSKIVQGPEKFWKAGRTTCITEGGKFHREHFFVRVKSRQKNSPQSGSSQDCLPEVNQKDVFGELTHAKFQTYCKTCRPKTSDLLDTSLLKEVKCYKCGETLPENSKSREFWAYNCFLVYLSNYLPFSEGGDSGAVIFDEDGRAWGIIVGKFLRNRIYTVAISLDIALEALKIESGKELKLLCVKPS